MYEAEEKEAEHTISWALVAQAQGNLVYGEIVSRVRSGSVTWSQLVRPDSTQLPSAAFYALCTSIRQSLLRSAIEEHKLLCSIPDRTPDYYEAALGQEAERWGWEGATSRFLLPDGTLNVPALYAALPNTPEALRARNRLHLPLTHPGAAIEAAKAITGIDLGTPNVCLALYQATSNTCAAVLALLRADLLDQGE